MNPFTYARATSVEDAIGLSAPDGHRLLGGGTNLIDLMRKGIEHPLALIDVTSLSSEIAETDQGGLLIGAATRNTTLAGHPLVRSRYPVLSRAILAGASAQIRNMATVAGNIMQRTRCAYFNDAAGARCNKRVPGSGCDAREGFHRYNAIIGGSAACIATHPSDMCVALVALEARVHLASPDGTRTMPLADFIRLPGTTPEIETDLRPDEIITAVELPFQPIAAHSTYRKVRDRASYAFALVSVAACVSVKDGRLTDLRLALGGVAPRPWRALQAERLLIGAKIDQSTVATAMDAEFGDAQPLSGNAFKIELATRTTAAVLSQLIGETS